MSTIPNFPQALLAEHARWHHANHHDNPSVLPPGYGELFLRFHRDYIRRALQWYQQAGYDPRLVAAWQEVPEPIRRSACYPLQAEMRIRNAPQSFSTADELGRFIEGSNLHGCIHQEAARIFGEPELNDFDLAPRNTIFYNIHGMIDNWYRQWEMAMSGGRDDEAEEEASAGGKSANAPSPVQRIAGNVNVRSQSPAVRHPATGQGNARKKNARTSQESKRKGRLTPPLLAVTAKPRRSSR
ncbi:hypothetical protein ACFFSY_07915 [Paenibacillus aurantiacus]|uniref:Tyrosinase copper-binding domain-containing protein n=1 Tax=Paenibacillus aurantiacus TaxID=1936118 RepID=A0ABV5KP03_9BACL